MGAKCQACNHAISKLSNGIGNPGDPEGCCKSCGALACGFHGHRDSAVPEYMCVECDPNLLTASALHSNVSSGVLAKLGLRLRTKVLGSHRYFDSVAEFFKRRPGYDQVSILGIADTLRFKPHPAGSDDGLEEIYNLPEEPKKMLMVAVTLIRNTDTQMQRLHPALLELNKLIKESIAQHEH